MKKEKDNTYLRIGTNYFKIVKRPLFSGDFMIGMVPWSRQLIKDDHGYEYLQRSVKSYDGFCCLPNHINYQERVGDFYNSYFPLSYKPIIGDFTNSMVFMQHVFKEQIELGLDYLKILFEKPSQILPIFCLVSKERATGKTLFINWMKAIFEMNMTYNTNEDFRSQFNSDWSGKLILAVDEVLLDRQDDLERIKNLSTARTFKAEAKGKDKVETDFFAKLILASNRESDFIKIDSNEIRFWIRKLDKIEKQDDALLEKLKNEIPHFVYFLLERPFFAPKASRMWFTPEQIWTKELSKIVNKNRDEIENELAAAILDIMEHVDIENFNFCIKDLQNLLIRSFPKIPSTKIRYIVKENWKLEPIANTFNYTKYYFNADGSIMEGHDKGRYFTITKSFLKKQFDDLMI